MKKGNCLTEKNDHFIIQGTAQKFRESDLGKTNSNSFHWFFQNSLLGHAYNDLTKDTVCKGEQQKSILHSIFM